MMRIAFVLLLFIALIYELLAKNHPYGYALQNITSVSQININVSSITITGFHFHPTNQVAEWVDRVFGNESVHFSSNTFCVKNICAEDLTSSEKLNSSRIIAEKIDYNFISNNRPICSIDLLGSANLVVSDPNTQTRPFTNEYKLIAPAIGNATLTIPSLSETWKCHYRGLYENWREETANSYPNFISVFFYCPQYNQLACNKLDEHASSSNDPLYMKIDMELISTNWHNEFTAKLNQITRDKFDKSGEKINLGVCIAIPYSSTDEDKADANGAMFQDWIRYYSRLGIRVFIYDRDGMSYKYVSEVLKTDDLSRRHTIYYNYTMRGLLDPESRGLKYDNNEMLGNFKPKSDNLKFMLTRYYHQGVDKTQTLTQCRFEAKSVYGIDHVLVADYDEFLYCIKANTTFESQAGHIQKIIKRNKKIGIDQLTFQQVVSGNRTSNVRDCVINKAIHKRSIFDCFFPYKNYITAHSVKSIHLGHKCPLTGYHSACPINSKQLRTQDCSCNNKNESPYVCSFLHFSTNSRVYEKGYPEFIQKFTNISSLSRNEISTLLYPN